MLTKGVIQRMSHDETWRRARERIRNFARSKSPYTLTRIQNPDDAEQEEGTLTQSVDTLVAIDNPDDVYVHQPESLGIERKKQSKADRK